jgi:hypothetical protein
MDNIGRMGPTDIVSRCIFPANDAKALILIPPPAKDPDPHELVILRSNQLQVISLYDRMDRS